MASSGSQAIPLCCRLVMLRAAQDDLKNFNHYLTNGEQASGVGSTVGLHNPEATISLGAF